MANPKVHQGKSDVKEESECSLSHLDRFVCSFLRADWELEDRKDSLKHGSGNHLYRYHHERKSEHSSKKELILIRVLLVAFGIGLLDRLNVPWY